MDRLRQIEMVVRAADLAIRAPPALNGPCAVIRACGELVALTPVYTLRVELG